METGNVSMLRYFINLSFVLYFFVLLAERAQSLVRCFMDKGVKRDALDIYMYAVVIISVVGAFVFLIVKQSAMFAAVFTRSAAVYSKIDPRFLCIAAGIILFSGMVHTDHTIPAIQFGSYGALVIGMILETVFLAGLPDFADKKFILWTALAFTVAFSMAIPVVYRSEIEAKFYFHIIEIIISAVMIVSFTLMLGNLFTGRITSIFNVWTMVYAAVGDAIILWMRWKEKVNTFVLIFIVLALVLWTVGKIAISSQKA